MELADIYRPIEKELRGVEEVLTSCLKESKNQSILKINNFLLESGGKRLRPALVILSAKAALNHHPPASSHHLMDIAAAIELIHMASLLHDDVIDCAALRHNRTSINVQCGQDVAIALGDYLYSVAFGLISTCGNMDIIGCISSATKAMCEGELLQVCERDNLDLLKERYMVIVKKKTASLFAASCQAGSLIFNPENVLQGALKEYGLNFGIAFQITDDYLDLVGEERELGKTPGQDIKAGEITLPVLNLLEALPQEESRELKGLLASRKGKEAQQKIRQRLFGPKAVKATEKTVSFFMDSAKKKIDILSSSPYKESLLSLADFVVKRRF